MGSFRLVSGGSVGRELGCAEMEENREKGEGGCRCVGSKFISSTSQTKKKMVLFDYYGNGNRVGRCKK